MVILLGIGSLFGQISCAQEDTFEEFSAGYQATIPETFCGADSFRACFSNINEGKCISILDQRISNCDNQTGEIASFLYNQVEGQGDINSPSIENINNLQSCVINQLIEEIELDAGEVNACLDGLFQ